MSSMGKANERGDIKIYVHRFVDEDDNTFYASLYKIVLTASTISSTQGLVFMFF